jgi:hypothetical protein
VSQLDDWVSGGIVPRRDHSPRTDLAMRNVRLSARLGTLPDKGPGTTRDELGRVLPDMKAFGAPEDTVGDDVCWGLWPRDSSAKDDRGIPGWANAWPTLLASDATPELPSDSGGTTVSGSPAPSTKAIPVRNKGWSPDTRFLRKTVAPPKASGRLASGWPAVVIAGTEELSQHDLGVPDGRPLRRGPLRRQEDRARSAHSSTTRARGRARLRTRGRASSRADASTSYPTSPGAGGIVVRSQAARTRPTSAGATPAVPPGGIAWQLGPDGGRPGQATARARTSPRASRARRSVTIDGADARRLESRRRLPTSGSVSRASRSGPRRRRRHAGASASSSWCLREASGPSSTRSPGTDRRPRSTGS